MALKISTLSLFLFGVLLCSIQNIFGQCLREIPALGYGLPKPSPCLGAGLASPVLGAGLASSDVGAGLASAGLYGLSGLATSEVGLGASLLAADSAYDISSSVYGGSGVGNLNVFGELPVGGSTLVSGQVPILGYVQFGGPLPAAGSVTISGSCNCGCNYGY